MQSMKENIIVPISGCGPGSLLVKGQGAERCAEWDLIWGADLPAINLEVWEWTKESAFKEREKLGVFWEKVICFYVYFYWFVSVNTVSMVLLKFEKKIQVKWVKRINSMTIMQWTEGYSHFWPMLAS